MRDEIRQAIKGGTRKATLDALRAQGVQNVHVIDEAHIFRLIEEAVEQVVRQRSDIMGERDALTGDARLQFQKMLRDHQKALSTQARIREAKGFLDEQLARISAQLGGGSQTAGLAGVRELGRHIDALLHKIEEKDRLLRAAHARADDLEKKLAHTLDAKASMESALDAGLQDEFGDLDPAAFETPEGRRALAARLAEAAHLRARVAEQEEALGKARQFGRDTVDRLDALQADNAALRDRLARLSGLAGELGGGPRDEAALRMVIARLAAEREELFDRLERQERQSAALAAELYALDTGDVYEHDFDPDAARALMVEV